MFLKGNRRVGIFHGTDCLRLTLWSEVVEGVVDVVSDFWGVESKSVG